MTRRSISRAAASLRGGLLLFVALCMAAPLAAFAAQTVHLTLTVAGSVIEGESTIVSLGRENTIQCLSFSQSGFTDVSAGPSGRRQYRPITIRKRIDKSSPLLFKAWAMGETVDEGVFRFYRPDPDSGAEEHYFTITIKRGVISSVTKITPSTLDPAGASQPDTEGVGFYFEEITYRDEISGAEHTDVVR